MSDNTWQVFDLDGLKSKLTGNAVKYLDFLNVPAINCGVYFLPAGSTDMQSPHNGHCACHNEKYRKFPLQT